MNFYKLSSLELSGYKTFASKTRFEFSGSITAIVGPNGSGKSNIADAIRWVLGEQAYSMLRGRKTEDMIFSGSDKRPKAGMASATVTFDNEDGWLPIDFSEVSITRRAYRDGQNEYLINQQKVRLKDVNELLSKSSLAERTYTVIGQGLVDTALTLNSDERRRLFEEAAGIGLYRNRKEQALRRLAETGRNLDRVADIMAELKPRLRGLERQAKRSDEYDVLRSDLRENLRSWYGYQWHRAQNSLINLRETAEAREEDLGLARQKQNEFTNELNQSRVAAQEMRIELNNLHRKLAELHASREKSGRELAIATERKRAIADQSLSIKAETQRLQTDLNRAQARLEENQTEQERLKNELDENESKLTKAKDELAGQLTEQEEGQDDRQQKYEALGSAKSAIAAQEDKRQELERQIAAHRQEIVELEKTAADLSQNKKLAQEEEDEVEAEIDAAMKKEKSLESDLEMLRQSRAELESHLLELEKGLSKTLKEKNNVNFELQNLRQLQASSSGFSQGANFLFQSQQGKSLLESNLTLGQSIKLDQQYEQAISAALGDYLEAVIIPSVTNSAPVLSLIENEDLSLSMIPLAMSSKQNGSKVPEGRGILGRASDLIEYDGSLSSVIDRLLGNVIVVESREIAMQQLERGLEDFQLVTLAGELFDSSGSARKRSSITANPLSIPRRIEEEQAKLLATEHKLQKNQDEIDSAQKELVVQSEQQSALRQQLDDQSQQLEQLRRQKQTKVLQLEQIDRQGEWFHSQLNASNLALEKEQETLSGLGNAESQLHEQLEAARKALEGIEPVTALPLDEFRSQVAHWEMRFALAERAMGESQRRIDEINVQKEQAQNQLAFQEKRQAELKEQEQQLQDEKKYLGSIEGDSGGEIEEIQAKIQPTEEKLSRMESELRILQDSEREAMTRLTSVERNHTQAQISLARQQESLGTLRGRIEDDFGLVAFEYEEEVSGPTPLPLGDLVERLPIVESVEPELEERLKEQRAQIRRLGSINPEARKEFAAVKARFEDMEEQVADLEGAEENLKEVITELDILMDREFRNTFDVVASEFRKIFSRLFVGGSARILLTDEENVTEAGIDIEARLPGKRTQRLALLSGGERSLTAAALVFALLKASPTPFCVMDEVDAMLDEANIGRFTDLLKELSENTQFVIITHNRNTVQVAEVIYGITMGRDTASQVISLKLDEVDERYSAN